jgi:hypothetical protein
MPTFSQSTLKRLCMLSQNTCAFTGCNDVLSKPTGTITGDVCHIRAASKKGARFDPLQSEEARHSFSNLVLMCVEHHRIIDAEPLTYTTQILEKMKRDHESKGVEEITPAMTKLAEDFFKKYNSISVISNSGQVAINSPGAIQINNLNLKTQKTKITFAPIQGSIGNNSALRGYAKYLIDRYNEFQKADESKTDRYKYMAIYKAIEREFGTKWDCVPETRFTDLATFLQKKINNTILGRNNKSKGQPNYHMFEDHPT